MTYWWNTLRGTVYTELSDSFDTDYLYARSAATRKWSKVLRSHIEEYPTPEEPQLDEVSIEDPTAGEPEEFDDRPSRSEILTRMAQEGQVAGVPDTPGPARVQLPAIHGLARDKSYSVGSAIELLSAIESTWSVQRTVETLKVTVLLLGDEVDRVQGVRRG